MASPGAAFTPDVLQSCIRTPVERPVVSQALQEMPLLIQVQLTPQDLAYGPTNGRLQFFRFSVAIQHVFAVSTELVCLRWPPGHPSD